MLRLANEKKIREENYHNSSAFIEHLHHFTVSQIVFKNILTFDQGSLPPSRFACVFFSHKLFGFGDRPYKFVIILVLRFSSEIQNICAGVRSRHSQTRLSISTHKHTGESYKQNDDLIATIYYGRYYYTHFWC